VELPGQYVVWNAPQQGDLFVRPLPALWKTVREAQTPPPLAHGDTTASGN
jgi:hypothetical protein